MTKDNSHVWFWPSIENRMLLFPALKNTIAPGALSKSGQLRLPFAAMTKPGSNAHVFARGWFSV